MTSAAFSAAEQEVVARAWLECAGLSGLETRVHPRDEMFGFIAAGSPRSDAHLFEYLRSGQEAFRIVEHVLAEHGCRLERVERLLDFACGCGRVARFFVHALGAARVAAAEIDPQALAFVGDTLGVATIASATDPQALRLGGDHDVVFVGSLFSHLPRPRFVAWLRALARGLRPDGLLVFTTHGEGVRGGQPADPTGFTFVPVSETSRLDPHEYGSAFVRPEVVHELVREAGLTPLGWAEREVWDLQDVFVARRSGGGEPRRLPGAPIVYGRIERACLPRPGHAWVGGGTRLLADDAPLQEVRLIVDGHDLGATNLGPSVADASGLPGGARVTQEWYAEGPTTGLAAGLHGVCAVATTATGRREAFGARGLRI
ncbi:MAG: class I SAM-dependent methyltransferase [Planctomycetota bacterium]